MISKEAVEDELYYGKWAHGRALYDQIHKLSTAHGPIAVVTVTTTLENMLLTALQGGRLPSISQGRNVQILSSVLNGKPAAVSAGTGLHIKTLVKFDY